MKRALLMVLTLIVAVWVLATATGTVSASDNCGFIATTLRVGGQGVIDYPYSDNINLRSDHSASAELITPLPDGTVFTVLEGSACNGGYRWMHISVSGVGEGWAVETNGQRWYARPYSGLRVANDTSTSVSTLLNDQKPNLGFLEPLFEYGLWGLVIGFGIGVLKAVFNRNCRHPLNIVLEFSLWGAFVAEVVLGWMVVLSGSPWTLVGLGIIACLLKLRSGRAARRQPEGGA